MTKKKEPTLLDIRYAQERTSGETDAPVATEGNAGTDLRAGMDWLLMPQETKLIVTSYKMIIPDGYVGMVCSRSGIALRNSVHVLNAPGIVDSSYRGVVGVILHNSSRKAFNIKRNDRIAQMLFMKCETPNFFQVGGEDFDASTTDRGDGGFGSTGVK